MTSVLFWTALLLIGYTFIGYPILLTLFNALKQNRPVKQPSAHLPHCTLIIPAYNEEQVIARKIENTLKLKFPKEKLSIVVVTDGSSDNTPKIAAKYNGISVLHMAKRRGKTHAMLRAVNEAPGDIVVFSDANTLLTESTLNHLLAFFHDPTTGCVAGEKQILHLDKPHPIQASEGLYWKWEAYIKKQESAFYSTMGAAGELFAIRKKLIAPLKEDTILDDFLLSMHVAEKGKRIRYAPHAIAREEGSASRHDEMERKTRIAAGAFQALGRIQIIKNPLRYPILFWQLFSHKILRWLFVPWLLVMALGANIALLQHYPIPHLYGIILLFQLLFYCIALLGFPFQNKATKGTWIFFPSYFILMNVAIVRGAIRHLRGQQSATWQRVQRGS
ncbi:MAG: glycosyltransferase family 2 protein [Bacteroidales bacterium]